MDLLSMSPQDLLDLGKPTEEYEELLEIWPPLQIDWSNQNEAVARLREMTRASSSEHDYDEEDEDILEETLKVPARDGFENDVRVFRPREIDCPGPLVVLYHGGGFILGDPSAVAEIARWLVKRFDAVVAAPAYRLAPEYPYPTPNNDTWDTFCWVAENASTVLKADPSKGFIVGGVSAGASMSIAIAHLARDADIQPPLTGLYSACGSARRRCNTQLESKYQDRLLSRSQPECIYNPLFSKDLQDLMRDCYQPDTNDKLFASLMWPEKDGHRDLPRTYLQVCGRDPSRDDALIFHDMLKNEGVETRLDLYAGLPHCFWVALKDLPESERWEQQTLEGFDWLLRR